MNRINADAVHDREPHQEPARADARPESIEDALAQLWQRPGFLLRRCLQQTSGVFEQSCAELDLTARQYDYLFILDKVGSIGQGEIGDALGLDRSTNTLVIKILERKKWITREVVEADTRRRLVRITDEGRAAFASAKQAAEISITSIAQALSPQEYQALIAILQKVVAANAQAAATLAGAPSDT